MKHDIITIKTEQAEARLYTYLISHVDEIEKNRKRTAVIICPGGGYGFVSDREAEPVAIRLLGMGYQAFVLKYSIAPDVRFPVAIIELAKSVALVRENAEKWNIDPDKIVVMGFSAGGHLAGSLGVLWNHTYFKNLMQTDNHIFKPNALVLSYPVITSGEFANKGSFENLLGGTYEELLGRNKELMELVSLEKQATPDTPATFLWHTYEDNCVAIENSLLFASALRNSNVPFECHFYQRGGHGLSLATRESWNSAGCYGIQEECQNWIELADQWMTRL